MPKKQYTMSFWHTTQNPAELNIKACLAATTKIVKGLAATLTQTQVALASRDTGSKALGQGIEIMVFYLAGSLDVGTITTKLEGLSSSLSLSYKTWKKQDFEETRGFDDSQAQAVYDYNAKFGGAQELSEDDIAKVLALTGHGQDGAAPSNDNRLPNIPQTQINQPFMVSRARYDALKNAKGDALADLIKATMQSAKDALLSPKTGMGTILAITGGIATIYKVGSTIMTAGAIAGMTSAWVAGGAATLWLYISSHAQGLAIMAAAAMTGPQAVVIAAVAVALVVVLTASFLALRDGVNVVLVANAAPTTFVMRNDYIEHGERSTVAVDYPAYEPGADQVPAGFMVYTKYQAGFVGSLSFFGTSFGAGFTRNGADFSIGVDCPNTGVAQSNNIALISGLDSKKACEDADGTNPRKDDLLFGDGWETKPIGYTRLRSANGSGNVHYVSLIME